MSRQRELEELYARLPKLDCKGLCQESCGGIGMSRLEQQRIRGRGLPLPTLTSFPCPLLDFAGRCGAYEIRPMICRLFGLVERMKCPHGCVPEGGFLPNETGGWLLRESQRIGGDPSYGP